MANTLFRIRRADDGTAEPAEPIFDAWPLVEAPPVLRYPAQKNTTGTGYPAATYGQPQCIIGRNIINATGLAFYNALYNSASAPYVLVKANLYDLRTETWSVYQAVLWRYTVDAPARAGYRFNNFRALLTELVPSSWGA